jgi:hypothetical protein
MLEGLILFKGQQLPDLLVPLPSDAHVFPIKQPFMRMPLEREAFRNDPQIDFAAVEIDNRLRHAKEDLSR